MSRPLLGLAVAFAAGALLGPDVGESGALVLLALSAGGLGLALIAPLQRAPLVLGATALALGAAAAGIEAAAYERGPLLNWLRGDDAREGPGTPSPPGNDPIRFQGVAAVPTPRDGVRHPLVLDLQGVGWSDPPALVPGRARVEIGGEAGRFDVAEGDRLELTATLAPPRSARSPGAFDLEAWAQREGLQALGYCKSPLLVKRRASCGATRANCLVSRTREWARERLRRHVLAGAPQGLVRAMVLGDRSGLDESTSEAFRRAGTYHVLALSGAQVALVAALLVAAGRRLEMSPLSSAVLVSLALGGYALFVGGDVPVTRAAVMGIVVVLGRGLDLDADLANLLGLAALVLLAFHPGSVRDVGFQLSFAATLAIVTVAPGLIPPLRRLPLGTGALIAGSVAAQAALQPLLALHFHRLTPVALLLNLAAVPLSGAVLLLGAAVLPLSAVSPWLGDRAGDLAWMAADTLLRTCEGGGLAARTDWRAPDPALWVLVPWAVSLRALAHGRWGKGLLLSALVTAGLHLGPGAQADGRFELAVLDVGQGDALVLRSPRGRTMVVDAGLAREGFDQGERIVAPFLWASGVRRVDRLVLTHAHPDHAGGLSFLIEAFRPPEVWEGLAPRRDPGYDAFTASLQRAEVTRRSVARGTRLTWDGVELEVLGPLGHGPPPLRTRNDDSVVVAARYGEVCALLTGDIEASGERTLALPPCAILKVPHHGSRTSTSEDLLEKTRPRLAVVSAGARNHLSHPHPEVLGRLRSGGVRILRTDIEGTVRITTDGKRVWLRRGRGGVEERVL
jgi:competence protein ComEC